MTARDLGNHVLVDASTEQLNHEQVQRARAGRILTLHMIQRVTRALNIAVWYRLKRVEGGVYVEYLHKQPHSYILPFSLRGFRKDRDGWATASQAISDRIRAARKRLGLSQAQFAKLVRVTKGTILTWETNLHSSSPTMPKRLNEVSGDGLLPSGQGNA